MSISPATVDDLGVRGALYLWALLTAHQRRLPVAPTERLTCVALQTLREHGVVATPLSRTPSRDKSVIQHTPIENLEWQYKWKAYAQRDVIRALDDFLVGIDHGEHATDVRLVLCKEIGAAEAESFFEHQLVRHSFPAHWSSDMAYAQQQCSQTLTPAQWRYCAWAAVRRATALAMQHRKPTELRETVFHEIGRLAARIAAGTWTAESFMPRNADLTSALTRGLISRLTNLGARFWTMLPTEEVLLQACAGAPRLHAED